MRMKKIFLLIAFTVHLIMRAHAVGGAVCCPLDTENQVKPVCTTFR